MHSSNCSFHSQLKSQCPPTPPSSPQTPPGRLSPSLPLPLLLEDCKVQENIGIITSVWVYISPVSKDSKTSYLSDPRKLGAGIQRRAPPPAPALTPVVGRGRCTWTLLCFHVACQEGPHSFSSIASSLSLSDGLTDPVFQ